MCILWVLYKTYYPIYNNTMKSYQKISFGVLASTIACFSSVFAAGIDHFQVQLTPEETQVGESMDLVIEAVDKNNNVIPNYDGTIIIFSETDPEAILPSSLKDNTYQFQAADQGKIKFENGVSFKAQGEQEISIYDLNDDTVTGIGQATVSKVAVEENLDISLLAPESDTTIGVNNVIVSGTTQKNHAVRILLNSDKEFMTNSNSDGLFELELTDLTDGENLIKAEVLNSDKKVVGTSQVSKIKVDLNKLLLKNIQITPESVEAETEFTVNIIANAELKEVNIILNDVLHALTESTEEAGNYSATIVSPKEAGDFVADVVLKNDIGHEIKELGAASLNVTEPELLAAEPEEEEEKEETPLLTSAEAKDLTIKELKLISLKSKSILTWKAIDDVEGYNVYKQDTDGNLELIKKVTEPKIEIDILGDELKYEYFAVKAIATNDSGILYEGDLSEATKIQTGPEFLILLLISLLVGGLFLFIKQQKS